MRDPATLTPPNPAPPPIPPPTTAVAKTSTAIAAAWTPATAQTAPSAAPGNAASGGRGEPVVGVVVTVEAVVGASVDVGP